MEAAQSDALVFFGASGDLAFKQIFPALLGLVAMKASTSRSSASRRPDGRSSSCGTGPKTASNSTRAGAAGLDKLLGLLRYVDGDYNDPQTFAQLKQRLAAPSGRCTIWRFRQACLASSSRR